MIAREESATAGMGMEHMESITRAVMQGPEIYRPGPLWQELAARHSKLLVEHGLDQFKRTVNLQYFNWMVTGIVRYQLAAVFRAWLAHPDRDVFRSRFDGSFGSPTRSGLVRLNRAAAWVYRTYVAMLASVLTRHDELGLLDGRVQEPRIGNPLIVRYRGSMLSQDLCNSVHEFYRVVGRLPAGAGRAPLVAELGAGYGRLAFVFLNAMPEVRYCIIDIPPALCLAQWYLTTVLPGVAAFRFREFSAFDEVREEFEDATLLFLAPHQIELLPPKTFDGFVNISSLHEMPGAQIRNYLEQIDRLTAGVFYTKQWRVSHMPAHGDPIGEHDYPVPSHWTVLFHRRHPFHRRFFEAMYRIPVRS